MVILFTGLSGLFWYRGASEYLTEWKDYRLQKASIESKDDVKVYPIGEEEKDSYSLDLSPLSEEGRDKVISFYSEQAVEDNMGKKRRKG